MATKTAYLPFLPQQSGVYYAFVRSVAGTLLNTGGDVLTHVAGGLFTFDLTESLAALEYALVTVHSSSTATQQNAVWYGSVTQDSDVCFEQVPPTSEATGGGGLTEDQQDQLNAIEAATGQITGARLQVIGPVTAAGAITIYQGSNYSVALGTQLTRTVSDSAMALYDDLTAFSLSELRFRAKPEPTPGQTTFEAITGTIQAVTESAGVTSIVIEIDADDIPEGPYHDGWKYHIFAIDDADGETPPFLEGDLTLKWKA